MAYILYINGHKIECNSNAISQTRQVNDLAKLDNRQSSVTNKFTAPFTPRNVKAMEYVYLTGSQSNVPYQKNVASLYDADSGACLIYNGWANITQSSKKGYDIFIYDGLIDFYRRIENKTLTDMDISGLNHSKSLSNIINSWNNTMPYMYAISDYNGKNNFTTIGGTDIEINTDYQVPSARVSYIWERIFAFAGFTFSGSYFQTQDFLNLFMTFPKPVPTLVPHKIFINSQEFIPQSYPYTYYEGNTQLTGTAWNPWLFNVPFISSYVQVISQGNNAGGAPNPTHIDVLQNGTYAIDLTNIPITANINWFIGRSGTTGFSGSFIVNSTNDGLTAIVSGCLVGDILSILMLNPIANFSINQTISYVDGYEANFEEAFVEFIATDFVKEVITHGGLTAFKDKYTDHIDYLTMSEILQSTSVEDWSSKFQYKDVEKYKFGNYAKRNFMHYRYNTENETHNDGYISINDDNLEDEVDVVNSKIYSPEQDTVYLLGKYCPVFKIWEKELQDDSTIEYKDLSGRFYFLRFEIVPISTTIASQQLSQQQTITQLAIASYTGLNWQNIINTNYPAIKSILDKAKVIDGYFYLKSIDIERFDFKSLIYVEQLSSYYLVNKIMNFVKGKVTKCELLEVDYRKVIEQPFIPEITITNTEVNGCNLTIEFETNLTLPTYITISGVRNFLVLPNPAIDYYDSSILATTNQITITVPIGGAWTFTLTIGGLISAPVTINNTGVCDYTPPVQLCIPSSVIINNVQHFQAGYPSPGSNGSYWVIGVTLNGVTNNDGSLFSTCMPYSVRVEKRVNGVLETINIPASYLFVGSFYFNTGDYPSSATFKVIFISPNGTEYQSNTYTF